MSAKLGRDAKLFYAQGGVAGGSWTEIEGVSELTLNVDKGEADVTTRGSQGWKQTLGALKDASIEFEMPWDPDEGAFADLQESFVNGTPIGLAIMDGAMESGTGLVADFEVMKFTRREPVGDKITASVTAKPTYSTTPPAWYVDGEDITDGIATPTATA